MFAGGCAKMSSLRTISLSPPAPSCRGPFCLQQSSDSVLLNIACNAITNLLQNDSYSYTKVRYSPPLEVPQGSKHQPITHPNNLCVCINAFTYKLQSTQICPDFFKRSQLGAHYFFVYLFQILYMFRATMCPSSGEFTVPMPAFLNLCETAAR